jgi:AraC-like DNA-binding protein
MSGKINMTFEELCPCVRKAGKQNCNSWKNRLRKIYDHEFMYCIKGKAYINIEDRKYEITPKTLILIKPDLPHSLWMDENNPPEIIWVHFDFSYRNDVGNLNKLVTGLNYLLYKEKLPMENYIRKDPVFNNTFSFPEFLKIKNHDYIKNLFKNIVDIYEEQNPMWQVYCKVSLFRILQEIMAERIPYTEQRNRNVKEIAETIADFINKNYYRKITLSDISKQVYLSEDYTGRIFKKQTGYNITGFINRVRMEKAKGLLLNTDLSITNISEMVGFSDIYYFSRVMKKYEGKSPAAWRKEYCNK